MSRIVIGFTGSFGSGCSRIANDFLVRSSGFNYISLSTILKDLFFGQHYKHAQQRCELQDYGNDIRAKNGRAYLAEKAVGIINETPESVNWVVDSIKNLAEVDYLRDTFAGFFLFGVFADYDVRWGRVRSHSYYNGDERIFKTDDDRDSSEKETYGQQVRGCFTSADIIIANNQEFNGGNDAYLEMQDKVNSYLGLITNSSPRPPSIDEALMAMAYANSQRSSCFKRKVGALIVGEDGTVLSSGFNEVPSGEQACKNLYGKCYRTKLRENYYGLIDGLEISENLKYLIKTKVIDDTKLLDYCRSLHAEENAILNISRYGGSWKLKGASLYTTTYPCNLCANKIAQVQISTVYYHEPYPMKEAKQILDKHKVKQVPFEGVSFKSYFRLFGGVIL
jgi:deoxycytidylate deaminase